MKIIKLTLGLACLTAATFLSACDSMHRSETTADCSAVFETRGADGKKMSMKKDRMKGQSGKTEEAFREENKPATECKVLEIKIDNKTKCELVGSSKIDALSKALSENNSNKIVLVAPQAKLRDLGKMAQKYLSGSGIDMQKHFNSDLFKNLDFPYKGMRCVSSGTEYSIWTGDKKVIVTIE